MNKNLTSKNNLKTVRKKWTRFDVKMFEIQPNLYLKSFWKLARSADHRQIDERLISITVNAYDKEIVKFDISFEHDCHYHVASQGNKKILLNGRTPTECVQQIKSVLTKEMQRILQQHPHPNISSIILENDIFTQNCNLACDQLYYFVNNIDRLVEENHKVKITPRLASIKTK